MFLLGDTKAVYFENRENKENKATKANLSRETEFTEITICVRFKFTLFLPERLVFSKTILINKGPTTRVFV